jgi:hypothetical protein
MEVLFGIVFGVRGIDTAAAFETHPRNPSMRFYRKVALGFFLGAAGLFLTASLVDTVLNARAVGEVFGWSAIGCLQVCVLCGLRYSAIGKASDGYRRFDPEFQRFQSDV